MAKATVTLCTPAAHRWLVTTQHARVLSVFEQACNLVNQDNELLALVSSKRGLNPFAAVVISEEAGLFDDIRMPEVRVNEHHLTLGALDVDFTAAQVWSPMPAWSEVRAYFAAHPETLPALWQAARPPAHSWLEIFHTPASPLSTRAAQGTRYLIEGLHERSMEKSLQGIQLIAGLGSGLTPAGDDFIVGVMLAIWAGLYGAEAEAEAFCAPLATAALPRTTLLSGAYLQAAARGECLIHWHALFEALISNADFTPTLRDLLAVGHTSGADALAGFLFSRLSP